MDKRIPLAPEPLLFVLTDVLSKASASLRTKLGEASELPMRWVTITDEYGIDPALRFKQTTITVNALTMISRRIERDEAVNLTELLRITRQQVARIEPHAD